jgi:hypothetical protein
VEREGKGGWVDGGMGGLADGWVRGKTRGEYSFEFARGMSARTRGECRF